ncbi:MAG: in-like serine protease [Dactylosporangium sp.]|nr:in-like serine protease [Dactylosporangium sp.]
MREDDPVVNRLVGLGLTVYEARAYWGLVRRERSTGTELARVTGLPRQRVYDVLERLVERGFAAAHPGRTMLYAAADPHIVQARTVWEFHTKPVTKGSTPVPVLNASYDIALDDYNRAKVGRPLPVSFKVHGPGGEDARTRIAAAHLGYSTDGGKTWSDLRVLGGEEGRSFALLPASALTAGHAVSLHLTARDKDGNSVDQTLIDAVPVA